MANHNIEPIKQNITAGATVAYNAQDEDKKNIPLQTPVNQPQGIFGFPSERTA